MKEVNNHGFFFLLLSSPVHLFIEEECDVLEVIDVQNESFGE